MSQSNMLTAHPQNKRRRGHQRVTWDTKYCKDLIGKDRAIAIQIQKMRYSMPCRKRGLEDASVLVRYLNKKS
ncbi:hypothetical protein WM40_26980 [Robbsia andropogonis]|uniref:Uncharacterized protein n=1 Tax=Robbsia andropogonis TaxID=28092 RepID=A0A0F5JT59_9BURK|nr:hypothetical protein WM40_26980 [Robbsia andropogonis]